MNKYPDKTTFEHIYMERIGSSGTQADGYLKPVYEIRNNKSDDLLGYIDFYPEWNQYVFESSDPDNIFSTSCLQDIIEFMEGLK